MSEPISFSLVPFEPLPDSMTLAITGQLLREGQRLTISYVMTGDLERVALPPLNTSTLRQDRLWEKTCFEFFLTAGPKKIEQSPYWEFNLSPTGAWNVFALSGYRNGLKEEPAFITLPLTVSQSSKGLRLEATVDLCGLAIAESVWRLGVSAVCVLAGGAETFWAIAHPGAEADFHHADSFVLQLGV